MGFFMSFKLKTGLSLIILVLANYSSAVIISYDLFKNGDKKVLIWGVRHGDDKTQKEDEAHKKLFFKWLSKLEKSNKSTNFIIEGAHWKIEHFNETIKGYFSLCKELPKYAKENNFKSGNVDYMLSDCRTKIYELSSVSQVAYLSRCVTDENIFHYDTHHCNFGLEYGYYCLNDFFKETRRILNQIKIDNNNEEFACITQLTNFLNQAEEEAVKLNINLKNDIFYNCANKEKTEVFMQWYLLHLDQIHVHLADIGFMIALSESLDKYDQTVLYCGFAHTAFTKRLLIAAGFEHIEHLGATDTDENVAYTKSPISLDKLKQLFDNPFKDEVVTESAFIKLYKKLTGQPNKNRIHAQACEEKNAVSSTEQKEEGARHVSRICAQCTKKKCKNKCSNCKAVYYCSVGCQKDHWKIHKINCKKQLGTI